MGFLNHLFDRLNEGLERLGGPKRQVSENQNVQNELCLCLGFQLGQNLISHDILVEGLGAK